MSAVITTLPRADGAPQDEVPEDFHTDNASAYQLGEEWGHRAGYVSGWRWGFICGAFAGGLLTAASLLLGMGKLL